MISGKTQYTPVASIANPVGPFVDVASCTAAPPPMGTFMTDPDAGVTSALAQYTWVASTAMATGTPGDDASTTTDPPARGACMIVPFPSTDAVQ